MTPRSLLSRFRRSELGSATLEFTIVVPVVFMMLFSSIDYGVVMLRQVFLDRAVEMTAREVRLGHVSSFTDFRDRVCGRTILLNNCAQTIAIEMRVVDPANTAGMVQQAQCVNRREEIAPLLEFTPGGGLQELMLVRVCVAADPFLRLTGIVMGMSELPTGGHAVIARTAWVNEPM